MATQAALNAWRSFTLKLKRHHYCLLQAEEGGKAGAVLSRIAGNDHWTVNNINATSWQCSFPTRYEHFTHKGHQNFWNQSNISMLIKKKIHYDPCVLHNKPSRTNVLFPFCLYETNCIILLATKTGKHNSSLPSNKVLHFLMYYCNRWYGLTITLFLGCIEVHHMFLGIFKSPQEHLTNASAAWRSQITQYFSV